MSDTQKHTKPNVPNLRFPGFEGEWEERRLGECCSGFDYGMNAASKSYDGVNGYIRITDIDEHTNEFRKEGIVSPDAVIDEIYRVRENDILFARTGASTGKTYIYKSQDGRLYFAGFLIRANVFNWADSRFVFYQTQIKRYAKWVQIMSMRSGQPGINSQEYASFQVNLPELNEQKKVASFIALLDQRISLQIKLIDHYESLIRAIYHETLNNVRGTIITLGNLVQIKKGTQLNGENLLTVGKYYVMNGGITPSGYYDSYNTPREIISISEGGNSCGYVQYNSLPFWSGGHCYTLLPQTQYKDLVKYRYLYHYLKYRQDDIMAMRIGSGLPNIQKKELERFQVMLPETQIQERYTVLFDAVDSVISIEKALLNKLIESKKYLISQMFI